MHIVNRIISRIGANSNLADWVKDYDTNEHNIKVEWEKDPDQFWDETIKDTLWGQTTKKDLVAAFPGLFEDEVIAWLLEDGDIDQYTKKEVLEELQDQHSPILKSQKFFKEFVALAKENHPDLIAKYWPHKLKEVISKRDVMDWVADDSWPSVDR
jgi:hypothetical protein